MESIYLRKFKEKVRLECVPPFLVSISIRFLDIDAIIWTLSVIQMRKPYIERRLILATRKKN